MDFVWIFRSLVLRQENAPKTSNGIRTEFEHEFERNSNVCQGVPPAPAQNNPYGFQAEQMGGQERRAEGQTEGWINGWPRVRAGARSDERI